MRLLAAHGRLRDPRKELRCLARSLVRSRLFRASASLFAGTAAGQLCLVLATPLLTRLYDPHAFGLFAAFNTGLTLLGSVITLRLDYAAPLEPSAKGAARLCWTAIAVALLFSLLFAALLPLLASFLTANGLADLVPLSYWLPAGAFLFACFGVVGRWQARFGRYASNGRAMFTRATGQVGMQIGLGFTGAGGTGLVAAQVLGQIVGLAVHGRALAELWRQRPRWCERRALRATLHRWRHFPLLSTPTEVVLIGSQTLPAFLMVFLYGPATGGLFALGQRLLTMPVRMVGMGLSQVFFAESRTMSPDRLRRTFRRTFLFFFVSAVIVALPVLLFAPQMFALAFGEDWRQAGVFVQLLLPLHVLRFAIGPVFDTLKAVERQGLEFVLATGMLGTVATVFLLARVFDLPATTAVGLLGGGLLLAHLVWLAVTWNRLTRRAAAPVEDGEQDRPQDV